MKQWRGQMEAILSSLCFGIAPILAKKGLMSGLHPFYGATIANGSALILIVFFLILTGRGKTWGAMNPPGIWLAILSGLFNSLALVSFFGAMSIGRVALVVPMTCIYPLFTMGVAYLAMKETETIDKFTAIGTFLIVTGVILTI